MILLVIILIIAAAIFISVFSSFYDNKEISGKAELTPVCFDDKCFDVEIASSFSARMKGLMGREFLADGNGMFFVFSDEDKHAFWMKNTLISLDIIWIGENKKIVYIAKNIQSCKSLICPSVSPDKPAKYVLEINGGKADESGLKVGDRAEFELRQ